MSELEHKNEEKNFICNTCIHQKISTKDYQMYCEIFDLIPPDVDRGDVYSCEKYEPDEKSWNYGLVQELMKRGKMLDKPWDFKK